MRNSPSLPHSRNEAIHLSSLLTNSHVPFPDRTRPKGPRTPKPIPLLYRSCSAPHRERRHAQAHRITIPEERTHCTCPPCPQSIQLHGMNPTTDATIGGNKAILSLPSGFNRRLRRNAFLSAWSETSAYFANTAVSGPTHGLFFGISSNALHWYT